MERSATRLPTTLSPFKGKKNSVPTKTIDTYRILALDAATNVTGYSVYDNGALVAFGTYKTNEENEFSV